MDNFIRLSIRFKGIDKIKPQLFLINKDCETIDGLKRLVYSKFGFSPEVTLFHTNLSETFHQDNISCLRRRDFKHTLFKR